MTYGDDRTAGAMSDDERKEYVRSSAEAMQKPMTIEPGGGDALRERLIDVALDYAKIETAKDVDRMVDAVLREIAAAGMVIVPVDRYERLRYAAEQVELLAHSPVNHVITGVVLFDGDTGLLEPVVPTDGAR